MRISRFYIDLELAPNQKLSLPANLVNYIGRVLRLKINDPIVLFNGRPFNNQAGEFRASIANIEKRQIDIFIHEFSPRNIESPVHINLLQGISRGERMDYTIQKAVELGITHIVPVFTQRSNVRLDAGRLAKKCQHWQNIANSACEQSGRTTQVIVAIPFEFANINQVAADIKLVLTPEAKTTIDALQTESPQSVNLLIGPEGGLTDYEMELAVKQMGYHQLKLGPRILRTETAGVAALSLLQFLWGDLNQLPPAKPEA